ncbi:uncharacterized protein KY384_007046 [Bacidia gigantensis]|uniref:uncharacterized protein n=1 Tax=Bacidia gigantensis TaxID=2732470 RepID=UPI001D03E42B|nr:uncharacterized protein KY384_007046 [Bacidia gigantensis]KAG8528130.1 hypothetical protein KY384_007046 [Bacidia gigantensis]
MTSPQKRSWHDSARQSVLLELSVTIQRIDSNSDLIELSASLKQNCPDGVYISLKPGNPLQWSGVLFARSGPYAPAILRFQIHFPHEYPHLPPTINFTTDVFHPLITPLTTYTYTTGSVGSDTVSATDDERLPPGSFSLRFGFPNWFGRDKRIGAVLGNSSQISSGNQSQQDSIRGSPVLRPSLKTPSETSKVESLTSNSTFELACHTASRAAKSTMFNVLNYIRRSFDEQSFLDEVPLESAGNAGAWKAWRAHRASSGIVFGHQSSTEHTHKDGEEWDWNGVWEDRVRKGIESSVADATLYGGSNTDDLSLIVRKQRQSNSNTATEVETRLSSSKAPGMMRREPMTKRLSLSSSRPAATSIAPSSVRFISSDVSGDADSFKYPLPSTIGGVSMQGGSIRPQPVANGYLFARQPAPSGKLRRGPSLKQRLVSRVRSGISGKPDLHATIEGDEPAALFLEGEDCQQLPAKGSCRRSISVSSTSQCFGTELSDALATFPEPPRPTNVSPESTEDSFLTPESQEPVRRDLSTPFPVPVLRPEIKFTPEFDHISFEEGESMFIAIDFKAAVPAADLFHNRSINPATLQIAVIVDNSPHTSPTSLMAHCETTRFLASTLDTGVDELTVISSNALPGCNVVVPLGPPKKVKIKSALDSIETGASDSQHSSIVFSLQLAQDALIEPRCVEDRDDVHLVFSHIFLLTTHIDDSFSQFKLDDRLTLHLICAAALPHDFERWPRTNGWKLRSLTGNEPPAEAKFKPENNIDDLYKDLISLVKHARLGHVLGHLKNIDWDFIPGKDFVIEEVFGGRMIASLQPGEVQSLILKISCRRPKNAEAWIPRKTPEPDNKDLFAELERVLIGFATTPVLGAAACYNHPMLPNDTGCSVLKPCRVKCFINPLGNTKLVRRPDSELDSTQRVVVQQRLAYYYHTKLRPGNAMTALQKVIEEGDGRLACPSYVALLMKEQQFQARADRRKSFANSPVKSTRSSPLSCEQAPANTGGKVMKTPRSPLAHRTPSMTKSTVQATGSPQAHLMPPDGKENFAASDEHKSDPARQIWTDLRLKARPNGRSASDQPATPQAHDEKSTTLRETAVKNRRSIGADTVRSLSSSLRGSMGLAAPWL